MLLRGVAMISRRQFLRFGVPLAGALAGGVSLWRDGLAADIAPDGAADGDARRYLIVNADDLGLDAGVNRGIFETHVRGILTSASLMVTGRAVEEAAREARRHPRLSVGIHVDLLHMDRQTLRTDFDAVAVEVERQMDVFREVTGRLPTHIDSHHHLHRRYNVAHVFLEASRRHGLPLRGFSDIVFNGGFWGQSPDGSPDGSRISADALIRLALGIGPGLTVLSCHPGYCEPGPPDAYGRARETEIRALTDPRVRRAIEDAGITLVSHADYPRLSPVIARARSRRRATAASGRRRPVGSSRPTRAPAGP